MQADDFAGCQRAVEQLLDLALDLRETVELFRELMQAPPEEQIKVHGVVRRTVELIILDASTKMACIYFSFCALGLY